MSFVRPIPLSGELLEVKFGGITAVTAKGVRNFTSCRELSGGHSAPGPQTFVIGYF